MDTISEFDCLLAKLEEKLEDLKANSQDQLPYRVIHLINNPADKEIEAQEAEYEAIEKENERLRARLSLLESGNNADVTSRIDEAVHNAHKIELLKQKISEYRIRDEKIRRTCRESAKKFRQACLSLLGFNIEGLKDNVYRLTHRDAVNEAHKLFFKIETDGSIKIIDNDYSRSFSNYKSMYLDGADSCPAYLAAIAMDYFRSSSQQGDVSMSLCQTMMTTMRFGHGHGH